jgi:hypothetical protein
MNIKHRIIALAFLATILSSSCKKDTTTTVSPDVKTYTFDINMAYKTTVNPNPACFIDVDKGVVYSVQTAPAHAADIDLLWYAYSSTQFYLNIPNANIFSIGADGFDAGSFGFGNWSVRNSGFVDYSTTLTKGGFANVKTVADLTTFIKNNAPIQEEAVFDGTAATFAKVYIFETGAKKHGIIIVNSNSTDSNGGRANITVKVEP